MADWFYGKDGTQHGPVSEQKIKHLLFSNEIEASTIVWHEGMTDWLPANQLPEFQSALPTAPSDPTPSATPTTQASPTGSTLEPTPPAQSQIYAPGQATQSPNYAAPIPTSGLSIASLVCGILAILACYIWGLFGLPAVICGHMALKAIRTSAIPIQGKGMAIAGLVCGYIGIALQIAMIIGLVFFFATAKEQIETEIQKSQTEMQDSQSREEIIPTPNNAPAQDTTTEE